MLSKAIPSSIRSFNKLPYSFTKQLIASRRLATFATLNKEESTAAQVQKLHEEQQEKEKSNQWDGSHYENPYVADGKGKWVGAWLFLTGASVMWLTIYSEYPRLMHENASFWPFGGDDDKKKEEPKVEKKKENDEPFSITNLIKSIEIPNYKDGVRDIHMYIGGLTLGVFLLPMTFFWAKRWIKPTMMSRMLMLLGIGGLASVPGYFMYQEMPNSALLNQRANIKPYQLWTHSSTSLFLFGFLMWQAFNAIRKPQELLINAQNYPIMRRMWFKMLALSMLIGLNILSGAAVTSNNAGKVITTWPTMDGYVFPPNLYKMTPVWRNFIEDQATAQFNHRWSGYATYAYATYLFARHCRNPSLMRTTRGALLMIFLLVNFEMLNGIFTLMHATPPEEGMWHQGAGMILLSSVLLGLHTVRRPQSKEFRKYLNQAIKMAKEETMRRTNHW